MDVGFFRRRACDSEVVFNCTLHITEVYDSTKIVKAAVLRRKSASMLAYNIILCMMKLCVNYYI